MISLGGIGECLTRDFWLDLVHMFTVKNISYRLKYCVRHFYFLIYKSFPKSLTRECILDANNW